MDLRAFIPSFDKEAKDDYSYKFTVFTPVYNAANTINRVHSALKEQTFRDFEWLIINDGSSDNSDTEIKKILSQLLLWSIPAGILVTNK